MAAENNDVTKHYGLNERFTKTGDKNVWAEFTGLARQYDAVNMGQGFPNYQSIPYINEECRKMLSEENWQFHQYTRSGGHPKLVSAIAKLYGKLLKREINPLTEVLVTVGAYGSLFNAFAGCLNKGDEVIIIEPFFDCYEPMVVMADAKCRFVPLKPTKKSAPGQLTTSADWCWDTNELESAFNSKTKMIIINTPNNPLGKIYTKEELEQIAALCIKHNVLCISDEVYEHMTYDREHIRIASLPGMWERTMTVGSAGKTFNSTGIKLGWTYGPAELIRLCQVSHQNNAYCCPTFMQELIGRCFEKEIERLESPECYFKTVQPELKPKRDQLVKLLVEAGMEPVIPEGGYFMLADISKIAKDFKTDETDYKDAKFVKWLIKEKQLATIPTTCFYGSEHKPLAENYIRFCFFKDEKTLDGTAHVLKNLNSKM